VCESVFVCECVCVREREREERTKKVLKIEFLDGGAFALFKNNRVSSLVSSRFLSSSGFCRPRHLSVDRNFFLSPIEFVSDETDDGTDDDVVDDIMSYAKSILDDTDLRVTRKFNGRFRQNSVSFEAFHGQDIL